MNGRRMVPFNDDGEVDTSMIPTALIERVDIITGGASAVYGSDAISGAVNVILKDDFEGVDIQMNTSQTGESDGQDSWHRRHARHERGRRRRATSCLSLGYQDREADPARRPAARPTRHRDGRRRGLRRITSPANRRRRRRPAAAARTSVAAGGSTTTVPTRVAIAGGPGLGQFRDDGTLGTNCSVFNFNPYNYYQTPLERYNGTVLASLDVSENAEVYSMFNYGKTKVTQQVAPSGVFGTGHLHAAREPVHRRSGARGDHRRGRSRAAWRAR